MASEAAAIQGALEMKDGTFSWKWAQRLVRLHGKTLQVCKPDGASASGGGTVVRVQLISGERGSSKKPNRFDVLFTGRDGIGVSSSRACFSAATAQEMQRWVGVLTACGAAVLPVSGVADSVVGGPLGGNYGDPAPSSKPVNGGWPAHAQFGFARSLLRNWDTRHLDANKEQAITTETPKLVAQGMTHADAVALLRSILYPNEDDDAAGMGGHHGQGGAHGQHGGNGAHHSGGGGGVMGTMGRIAEVVEDRAAAADEGMDGDELDLPGASSALFAAVVLLAQLAALALVLLALGCVRGGSGVLEGTCVGGSSAADVWRVAMAPVAAILAVQAVRYAWAAARARKEDLWVERGGAIGVAGAVGYACATATVVLLALGGWLTGERTGGFMTVVFVPLWAAAVLRLLLLRREGGLLGGGVLLPILLGLKLDHDAIYSWDVALIPLYCHAGILGVHLLLVAMARCCPGASGVRSAHYARMGGAAVLAHVMSFLCATLSALALAQRLGANGALDAVGVAAPADAQLLDLLVVAPQALRCLLAAFVRPARFVGLFDSDDDEDDSDDDDDDDDDDDLESQSKKKKKKKKKQQKQQKKKQGKKGKKKGGAEQEAFADVTSLAVPSSRTFQDATSITAPGQRRGGWGPGHDDDATSVGAPQGVPAVFADDDATSMRAPMGGGGPPPNTEITNGWVMPSNQHAMA